MHFSYGVVHEENWNDIEYTVSTYVPLQYLYNSNPSGWFFGVYILASNCKVQSCFRSDSSDVLQVRKEYV